MDRRAAKLAAAYVAFELAASYALLAFLDTADEPADAHDAIGFGAFFVTGTIASVATGAALQRGWTVLLPAALVVAAIPAGDLVFELPLWAFLLVCSPFAAAALALGVSARRFARERSGLDAVWISLALTILGLGYASVATMAYGWNPWEGYAERNAGAVYLVSFFVVVSVGWCLVVAARRAQLPK